MNKIYEIIAVFSGPYVTFPEVPLGTFTDEGLALSCATVYHHYFETMPIGEEMYKKVYPTLSYEGQTMSDMFLNVDIFVRSIVADGVAMTPAEIAESIIGRFRSCIPETVLGFKDDTEKMEAGDASEESGKTEE